MSKQTTTETPKKKGREKGKPVRTGFELDSANLHPVNAAICKRFRQLWEESGLTQEDFAKENNLNTVYVKQAAQGRFTPSHSVIYDLAQKYRKSVDWFYSAPIY